MRVSLDHDMTREAIERRAAYYRARGYRVAIVEHKSERAGSFAYLHCEYRP